MRGYGSRAYRVREWVLEQARLGRLRAGDRLPAPHLIAQEVGVSTLTVQRALNQMAQEGLVVRRRRAGTFLSHAAHPTLRPVAPLRLALLLPKSMGDVNADFYLGGLYQGIQQALAEQALLLTWYDYEALHQAELDTMAGALAIAPPLSRMHELQQLNARFPITVVGAAAASWGLDSVACDNETPMRESVQRLVQLGHRRIIGLFADLDALDTQERLQAFCRAASEASLSAWYTLCAYDTFQLEPTLHQQLLNLLRLPVALRPTAVVAGGFYMAMGALQAAHALGLRVPEDLSVIGFDDPPAAALTAPPLSTYRQPLQAMGQRAAQHLLQVIQNGRAPEPLLQRMPTPYIERRTVAPIVTSR